MNVSSILRRKGTHVETARGGICLAEAARRLCERGVGSLVITDEEGEPLGVLSERDLVRAFAGHGAEALELPAQAALGGPAVTCAPQDSIRKVMSLMTTRRARHVVVLADGALVGLVSIGDVVKNRLGELELEVDVLRDYARMRV